MYSGLCVQNYTLIISLTINTTNNLLQIEGKVFKKQFI